MAAAVARAGRLLLFRYGLLIGVLCALVRGALVHFTNRDRYVVEETFCLVGSWPGAVGERLEWSLQIAELLCGAIVIAPFQLIELILQLGQPVLFGFVNFRKECPRITSVLLDLNRLQTRGMKIASLQILTRRIPVDVE